MIRAGAAALAVMAAACATPGRDGAPATEVRKADGTLIARATVHESRAGVEVRVQAAGLAPGRYGVHVHAVGRCEGPDFASAGPHWNPAGRRHGTLNPQGHHLGDLPNLEIGADGAGRLEFAIDGAMLEVGGHPLFDADGASIVVHADPDDYRTDPSGNSGARIACGVLRAR